MISMHGNSFSHLQEWYISSHLTSPHHYHIVCCARIRYAGGMYLDNDVGFVDDSTPIPMHIVHAHVLLNASVSITMDEFHAYVAELLMCIRYVVF